MTLPCREISMLMQSMKVGTLVCSADILCISVCNDIVWSANASAEQRRIDVHGTWRGVISVCIANDCSSNGCSYVYDNYRNIGMCSECCLTGPRHAPLAALATLKYPHLWPFLGLLSPSPALQAVALPSQISSPPRASILVALATSCSLLELTRILEWTFTLPCLPCRPIRITLHRITCVM